MDKRFENAIKKMESLSDKATDLQGHVSDQFAKVQKDQKTIDGKLVEINKEVEKALNSFEKPVILILGGKDKGKSEFNKLEEINSKNVKKVICYGESGENIFNQLDAFVDKVFIENFEVALRDTILKCESGDIVLLSPGCASFDQFNSFEDRGNSFKKIVKEFIRE